MTPLTRSFVQKCIKKMQNTRILVIGDMMLDQFIYGKVSRISPEAPVPVVQVTHESAYPGGAANVARNLSDFGIPAVVAGLIGRDTAGERLSALLSDAGISTAGLTVIDGFSTIVKTRVIARHQQVVRVDREQHYPPAVLDSEHIFDRLDPLVSTADAIIIEDYGKGFVTQNLVNRIIKEAGAPGKPVAVDPNPLNPLDWSGATVVKPNRSEAFFALGLPDSEDLNQVEKAGEQLLRKWRLPYVLITLGEQGMMLFHPPTSPYHTPTRAREVFDVSGAGDTVIAFFTAALAAGLNGRQAAEIANHAAGVVVGKLGTATLEPQELIESFEND